MLFRSVLVTHDLPVVAQTCMEAAVMYAGKIVENGPTDALYHAPRHPYTRLLFGATPDLGSRDDVVSIPGVPPRLDAPITGCAFAPRCDSTFGPCGSESPELVTVSTNHTAACHLVTAQQPVSGSRP